jgi:hypothetical protein
MSAKRGHEEPAKDKEELDVVDLDEDLDEELEEDELDADLDEEDLDEEDLDEEDLDDVDLDEELEEDELDADLDEEDDVDVEDADSDASGDDEAASEDADEDDEDEEDEEVESALDDILRERFVVSDLDDEPAEGDGESDALTRVRPRQPDEFVCQSCFLVKSMTQLADSEKMFCRDCV